MQSKASGDEDSVLSTPPATPLATQHQSVYCNRAAGFIEASLLEHVKSDVNIEIDACEGAAAREETFSPSYSRMTYAPSCLTVCKPYVFDNNGIPTGPYGSTRSGGLPTDFVTWCCRHGVGLIVRANFQAETGLVSGSYDPATFQAVGISHIDIPTRDHDGGIPERHKILKLLDACGDSPREGSERPAVLIHCKGGFGRSVVYACCLLIHWHDVPGRALLGWVRIVRTGSITTPDQERFLCKLGGRADLARHLERNGPSCCVLS